jgi:uridine kinase
MIRIITLFALILMTSLWGEEQILIGIAGGTGSGKTTLARKLQEAFGQQAILIEQDSYYKDHSYLSFEQRGKQNYDHPDSLDFALLREHLVALKNNCPINKPVYNFKTHSREQFTTTVQPARVIIVEGILLLAMSEIRELFDLKIFIDADDDIRLLRRIERDITERGREFSSVKAQYLSTVKPMHLQFVEPSKGFADVIIPGVGDNSAAMGLILSTSKVGTATHLFLNDVSVKTR